MRLLKVALFGNPVLYKNTKPVDLKKEIKTIEFIQLIEDMFATMYDEDGVGLAGPQVYVGKSIFVMLDFKSRKEKPKEVVVINPRIIRKFGDVTYDWEGCLSVPGVRGYVPRYSKIEVEYYNRDGEKIRRQLEGFPARVFQHEYDHLKGILYLERVDDPKKIISFSEWQKQFM